MHVYMYVYALFLLFFSNHGGRRHHCLVSLHSFCPCCDCVCGMLWSVVILKITVRVRCSVCSLSCFCAGSVLVMIRRISVFLYLGSWARVWLLLHGRFELFLGLPATLAV